MNSDFVKIVHRGKKHTLTRRYISSSLNNAGSNTYVVFKALKTNYLKIHCYK